MNESEKLVIDDFNRLNEPFHIRENSVGPRWELISPAGCWVSWNLAELIKTAEIASRAFRVGKLFADKPDLSPPPAP